MRQRVKFHRFLLQSFLLLGMLLAIAGLWHGSLAFSFLALVIPILALALYQRWVNQHLKQFDDSYPPGFNLVYTDTKGVRRSAFLVRMEYEYGRALLQEADAEGNKRSYVIPISSFIAGTIEMRERHLTESAAPSPLQER
jgi:hypothetical protein